MNIKASAQILLFILSLTAASRLAYDYFTKKKKREITVKKKDINEVIMFSYGVDVMEKSKYSRCVITKSMSRLLYYLNSTKQTLDICMYVLTNQDIANVLLKLRHRGVKIRVIVDADMAYSSGSYTKKLESKGMSVRWMKSTQLMHHKFCLIDASTSEESVLTPVVMAGSLNWTSQALSGNWEDVIVTSQSDLVKQYKDEFDRLWVQFKPIVNY